MAELSLYHIADSVLGYFGPESKSSYSACIIAHAPAIALFFELLLAWTCIIKIVKIQVKSTYNNHINGLVVAYSKMTGTTAALSVGAPSTVSSISSGAPGAM
jgi:hypothetical protein